MKVCVVACMLAAVAFRLAAADVAPSPVPGVLTVGYYNDKCSISVESIVNDTVIAELKADISKAAGLLRLMFHDCFVRVRL
ncbi:hypothetical protein E2562_015112 [Oryza meyeriana var. granulata]|uniref:Plant heme peroxidase family profile domain-containing protein n=1 Tax=Oryza meyeriana var. granulata TaxID=110450 RepID=A0A6G1DWS0_9ORYZ|nr:hypothetical protein E2562_015112 [Oryza meyeriana var. granulata]